MEHDRAVDPKRGRPIGKTDRGEIADPLEREIAALLLRHRKRRGMSRRTMADLAGVAHNSLYRIEHGIGSATLRTIVYALGTAGYELVIIPKED